MTLHQDTHNGSGKAAGRNQGDGSARTIEAAEAALHEAAPGAASEGQAAVNEVLAGSRDWMGWAQKAGQANMKACQALLGCRSLPEVMSVQSGLFQEQFKLLADNTRRMTMATWQTALRTNEGRR
jgi:hypothetical protein